MIVSITGAVVIVRIADTVVIVSITVAIVIDSSTDAIVVVSMDATVIDSSTGAVGSHQFDMLYNVKSNRIIHVLSTCYNGTRYGKM